MTRYAELMDVIEQQLQSFETQNRVADAIGYDIAGIKTRPFLAEVAASAAIDAIRAILKEVKP